MTDDPQWGSKIHPNPEKELKGISRLKPDFRHKITKELWYKAGEVKIIEGVRYSKCMKSYFSRSSNYIYIKEDLLEWIDNSNIVY